MLKELVDDIYLHHNYNCCETVLIAANQAYGLGMDEKDFRAASGFGAGMCTESVRGALSGAIMAIGLKFSTGKAHETEGFMPMVAEFYNDYFKKQLGSDNCAELKKRYRYPDGDDRRCLLTIEKAAQTLEKFMADKGVTL